MTNTGTWNSDFALFFVFVFFSPIVLFFAAGILLKMLEIYMLVNNCASPQLGNVEEGPELETFIVEQSPPKTTAAQKTPENSDLYSDAVSGLVGIGYKKSEARRITAKALNNKDYQKAEDIITDVISSVYK